MHNPSFLTRLRIHAQRNATRRRSTVFSLFLGLVSLSFVIPAAHASFHLMQVEQVIGGVDGDVTAQAIQLRMRAGGQRFLHSDAGGSQGPAGLVVYDAAGANPVTLIVFPNDVANGAVGDRVLITSPNFASHGTSTTTPDFTMMAVIPASYLAAGRLDYIDGHGDVLWSLSYGGAAYAGPLAAPGFNGSFGSPFVGPLPSDGTSALLFQGVATATSAGNASDYLLTPAGAVFTNNAGEVLQLPVANPVVGEVSITAARPKALEAGRVKGVLRVSRTGDSSSDLTISYKVGGSASAGAQYRVLGGSVLIPAGQSSANIKVVPKPDGIKTGDTTVKVTILPGDAYTIGASAKAKVKIIDAD